MGLLSWFFGPSDPAGRVAVARELLAAGRYNDARLAIDDLTASHPDARLVGAEAAAGLCRLNLEIAVGYGNSGAAAKADDHLALAAQFRDRAAELGGDVGALDLAMRRGHSGARDGLATREAERAERRAGRKPERGGRNPFEHDQELDARAIRVALLLEGLPPALRAGFTALGPAFADAVMAREDGRGDEALAGLAGLSDEAPLVWWERALTAQRLRDLPAAVRAGRRFTELAEGHHSINGVHTGEWLAARLAESGRVDEAMSLVRALRAVDPKVGRFLHASLLEATGALAEADALLVALSREQPNEMAIYAMLGRIRIAGGQRTEALRALEAAMNQCACGTGKCGAPQPVPAVVRPLATLYLEDGLDRPRGLELAAQARAMVKKPSWDDVYLAALAARGTPGGAELAASLRAATPVEDPRWAKLRQHLGAEVSGAPLGPGPSAAASATGSPARS